MGLFSRGSDKPGTDWQAKKDAAGSKAKPADDRPYRAGDVQAVSENDVTTSRPANVVDDE